ncbi:unnamed protein product [Symbiodinium sp. CCMP2592]|nr:unnamed protein product [Symbiodinium sp. CCMP2592]
MPQGILQNFSPLEGFGYLLPDEWQFYGYVCADVTSFAGDRQHLRSGLRVVFQAEWSHEAAAYFAVCWWCADWTFAAIEETTTIEEASAQEKITIRSNDRGVWWKVSDDDRQDKVKSDKSQIEVAGMEEESPLDEACAEAEAESDKSQIEVAGMEEESPLDEACAEAEAESDKSQIEVAGMEEESPLDEACAEAEAKSDKSQIEVAGMEEELPLDEACAEAEVGAWRRTRA